MTLLTQPIADLALTYTPTSGGAVVVDLVLAPTGDAALVAGKARLAQDIARFMVTPAGASFADPTYGTALWAELGRPEETDDETYASLVEEAEAALVHGQAVAAAAGYVDIAAQLDHVTDTRVDRSKPGVVAVGFVAVTKTGEQVSGSTPVGG